MATGLEEQALAQPARIAARDADRSVTFAELDALAATLAARLHDRAAGRHSGVAVPLLLRPDVASVVAIHAAIRAGVPFCPIDDTTPPAVVAGLLRRLGDPDVAVVAHPDLRRLLPAEVSAVDVPTAPSDQAEPQPVDRTALSMVLFTSGSTGRAKGVLSDWASLDERNAIALLSLTEGRQGATTAITSPFGFIAGFIRAVLPAAGGGVSVFDASGMDPVAMLERIDREQLDVLSMVPSLAAVVGDRWPAGRRLESVRVLYTYGEALQWSHVPRLRELIHPDAVIVAKYGASEATGEVLRHAITPDLPVGEGRVPMGSVFASGRVRLDPVGPDPDGPRELIVHEQGGGIAMGYLDDPELTEQRFGRDPDGTRFWRSGDICESDGDGVYRQVGRLDEMLKVRGRLVEPAEPERVLALVPGIRSAVVLPHTSVDGTVRLVAHVEVDDDSVPTPADVHEQLAAALAPHLVPQVLVRHDRLPLNSRGKVDRALLRSQPVEPWRTAPPRPPVAGAELLATAAAGRVLGIDLVSADDDMWELGLDSLAAMELVADLESRGWPPLDAAALLEHRSPAALARLREAAPVLAASDVVVFHGDASEAPVFCVPGAGATGLAYSRLAAALGPHRSLVAVEQRGLRTGARPDTTVDAAARRLVAVVTERQPDGDVTLIGHSAGGAVAYEAAARLQAAGRGVRVVLLDARIGRDGHGERRLRRAALRGATRWLPASWFPPERRMRGYYLIGGHAQQRYAPSATDVPTTLLAVSGSTAAAAWAAAGVPVETAQIGGDHLTMLADEHALEIVAHLGSSPR